MKLFADSAIIEDIRAVAHLIDGVTTNPSLIAKSGKKFEDVIKEIVKIVNGPISAEVISTEAPAMLAEARRLAKIHKNIVVKIPLTSEGMKAVQQLTAEGIKTNVTLCFSANQALLAAKAGATYISPFIGRLDDIGQTGMDLISEMRQIYDNYAFKTQILAASIRHPIHVKEAALLGADAATVPPAIIEQMLKHSLTDAGIQKFLDDWKKVPKQ